ncbi:EamA family transporter [Agarivorans sp. QJM3NY_33]|uniref:EamA family transporter n=1 Tax=Agarivorans sp. QJM3NY_33 TaxID=3421432 RepID=UPI003D7EEF63
MPFKDLLLALTVVLVWGLNFVVIKVALYELPPMLLAGLRFSLVAFPAVFLVKPPKTPFKYLLMYGMAICFGQFLLLFLAINLGMPAGLASLVLQMQAFFTIMLGVWLLSEKLRWNHIVGIITASLGMALLADASLGTANSSGIPLIAIVLTLGAALSWALGNISNKLIMRDANVSMLSLVIWSALVPIVPFFLCSFIFEAPQINAIQLTKISSKTIFALIYLAFIATIVGYAIWGRLLSQYETWRIAPLSLLVPVVGILSAALLLGETLSTGQLLGALIIIFGLLLNIFGGYIKGVRRLSPK